MKTRLQGNSSRFNRYGSWQSQDLWCRFLFHSFNLLLGLNVWPTLEEAMDLHFARRIWIGPELGLRIIFQNPKMWFLRNCFLSISISIKPTRLFLYLRFITEDHPPHNSWTFNPNDELPPQPGTPWTLSWQMSSEMPTYLSLARVSSPAHFTKSQFTCSLTLWLPRSLCMAPSPWATSFILLLLQGGAPPPVGGSPSPGHWTLSLPSSGSFPTTHKHSQASFTFMATFL